MVELKWDVTNFVEVIEDVHVAEGTLNLADYHGFDVTAGVAYDGERLVVESLCVHRREGGEPVTGEALRKITVQSVLRDSLRAATKIRGGLGADLPEGTPVRAQGMITVAEAERLRDEGPTAETLNWVARIYRVADVIGDPPTKAVREAFGISQSTAGNWIGRARSAGLIPPVKRDGGR
ncbi:hypothetical protein ACVDFE_07905 [Lentzea chajnantorensis]